MFDVQITIPLRRQQVAEQIVGRAPEWSHVAASGYIVMGWQEMGEKQAVSLRDQLQRAGILRVDVSPMKVVV